MGEMLSSDDLRIEFTYEEATNTGSRQTGESAADEILQEVVIIRRNRDRDSFKWNKQGFLLDRGWNLREFFSLGTGGIINNTRKAGKPGLLSVPPQRSA